jgi:hypothetical protein
MPNTPVPAAATGLPETMPRRGFLRGLASLPLIGGGVTLIGSPTKAAVPVTDALHERYLAWLAHEHRAAVHEHMFRGALASWKPDPGNYEKTAVEYATRSARGGTEYMHWFPDVPDIKRAVASAPPSTRAAIVLATVGCDWQELEASR